MKFFYLSTLFLIAPSSLCAMQRPLNDIEKGLVLRKINLCGLSAVENSVKNTGTLPVVDLFCKNPDEQDPLKVAIFKEIAHIEKWGGYKPMHSERSNAHPYSAARCDGKPTNYLGFYTRYYWGDENYQDVHTESDITNKNALMEIINREKAALTKALNGKSETTELK